MSGTVKKKRELFLGPLPMFCSWFMLPYLVLYPHFGSGLLTWFPFDSWKHLAMPYIKTVLTYLLGSTDPQPIAVHVEPFSTSVFKGSHLNICYYHQDLHYWQLDLDSHPSFYVINTSSYINKLHYQLSIELRISNRLERHPFSGLMNLASKLLRTS